MFSYLSCFRIVFYIFWLVSYSHFNYHVVFCTVWISNCYWNIKYAMSVSIRQFRWIIHCHYWCTFIYWEVRYCHFIFHFLFCCALTKWFCDIFKFRFISISVFRTYCYFNFHNICCFIRISDCYWNFEFSTYVTVRYFSCVNRYYWLVSFFREIWNAYFAFDFIRCSWSSVWFCDFSCSRFIFIILRLWSHCNFDCYVIFCAIWICDCHWNFEFTRCLTVWNLSWIIHCYYWCTFIRWEVWYCDFVFHFLFCCALTKWFCDWLCCWFIRI